MQTQQFATANTRNRSVSSTATRTAESSAGKAVTKLLSRSSLLIVAYLLVTPLAVAQNLADFALGGSNICVIDTNGSLDCTTRSASFHLPPDDGTLYQAISSGLSHSCAITQSGDIRCWGTNDRGQLDVPVIDGTFVSVSASGNHTCAIDSNTQVHCWGLNTAGQTDVPEPNSGFVSIHTGSGSSCGVKESGELVCWTTNTQITDILPENPAYTDIVLGEGGANVQSCGLTPEGAISCWARNQFSVDIPTGGPYTEIQSNYGWLCGLTTSGALDCNVRTGVSTFVDDRNLALANEVAALPPLSSFEILTQSSTITSFCGISLDGNLVCIGSSLPANTLPGAPELLLTDIPIPEDLEFVAYSDTTIELFWDFSNAFISSSRNIYRDGVLIASTNNRTSFIDDTLQPGQEYVYTVSLVATNGVEGAMSEPLLVSTDGRGQAPDSGTVSTTPHPGDPTNITITRYADTFLELFWDRSFDNPLYLVYRNGEFLAFAPGPSYFDDDVNPDTNYHYTIVARERTGNNLIGVGFVNEPALNTE